MYIKGKEVRGLSVIRDSNGEFIDSTSECCCCNTPWSFSVKVTFDTDWDNTVVVDICASCILDDFWFLDYDDLRENG